MVQTMLIGVPKEIKNNEYRIGMTPAGVRELTRREHQVVVQSKGGHGIGFDDEHYAQAGAEIAATAEEIFERAEMIVKVKEPQPNECRMLSEGQILFTYLHLAPDPEQTRLLVESGCTAIAYETVTDAFGGLPLLSPMSEVAGRMSIQAGAFCLEKPNGGNGTLLGGVPGVAPGNVVVIGGGVVGVNAARMAIGMGADVVVMDNSPRKLVELDNLFGPRMKTMFSTIDSIDEYIARADLVVGAVLIPGAAATKLVVREQLGHMKRGAVIVDVAIDQGGCFETSKATTHEDPTYLVDDVVHYCVANMPGAVARTSTFALTNATMPYIVRMAEQSPMSAMQTDLHLLDGLNVHAGQITYEAVANDLGYEFKPAAEAIGA
jgi:alanine dehydrogenase